MNNRKTCGWGAECCGGDPAGCWQPGEAPQYNFDSDPSLPSFGKWRAYEAGAAGPHPKVYHSLAEAMREARAGRPWSEAAALGARVEPVNE